MNSAALAAWAAVMAVGLGFIHRYGWIPWRARRKAERERREANDLFLQGREGVEGLTDPVQPAFRRLFRVESLLTTVVTEQQTMKGTLGHVATSVDEIAAIVKNGNGAHP